MEINKLSSAVGIYKKIGTYKSSAGSKTAAPAAKKVDTVEISSAARQNIESAKAAAARAADEGVSADKIAALKAKIADGSYNISPENVAAAILEG
ncbi:MAG: flagellar biosynthesis anti-sigma factor FlgM [Oscillospiraceae bacterium]|nr:flagellar biosynthesis anti-sigma factor FlgM [Oscillospiraceae bacterium]